MICITPIDLGISTGNHCQLHIVLVDKQLSNCAAVTVDRDSSHPDGSSDNHPAQVIAGKPRGDRIRPFTPEFRGINAGQTNPLAIGCSAGITVVAVADGHDLSSSCLSRRCKHRRRQQLDCHRSKLHQIWPASELEQAISTIGSFAIQGNAPFDRCQKHLCGWRVRPRNRRYQPWSTLHLSRSQKQTDFWPLLQQSQQTTGLVLWSADLVRHANRRSTRTALGALGDNDPTPRAHGPRAPLARSFDPFLSRQAMG